ncbi:MAG: very short patch repair endonuclease, partial [Bacteroidota bacterium]|nr:very short patch repair endonuclease [Bacteroidota bacterium]
PARQIVVRRLPALLQRSRRTTGVGGKFLFCGMADVHSRAIRSFNMSRIKGKDTKPEMLVRRFLHANGFRYKLHDKKLPGKLDIVLPKYKTVIFVHGCFWHGHKNCKYFVVPKTRTDWWLNKINGNIDNDAIKKAVLKKAGLENNYALGMPIET